MNHLIYRDNTYYFNRRVPVDVKDYDPRKLIRFSLKTDSKKKAYQLAVIKNAELERYWQNLIETGRKHAHDNFIQVVKRCSIFGFAFKGIQELAIGPVSEIADRLEFVERPQILEKQAEAVLGTVAAPVIMLDDLLPKFWELTNDVKLTKSPHQYKKWQNPRKLAMKNLIGCIGNKAMNELVRDDFIKFRDWWIDRIEKENLKNSGARTNMKQLRTMIRKVGEHFKLKLDITHLFHELILQEDSEPRPPFTTEFILNVILNPERLSGMNDEYQKMLMVFSETGVGIDEQAGVLPEDIFLDGNIPYIVIQPRRKNQLKTKYRKRVMPLVGYALDAYKAYPQGFSKFVENPDNVSSAIGKYLRENQMLPTDRHSAYSLRHSFQDRLTAIKCIDRIQVDLMGHRFDRELYGVGAPLEEKYLELKKIQLKP